MKTKLFIVSLVLGLSNLFAQTAAPAAPQTFIKGDMAIKFNTRTQVDSSGKPRKDVVDVYTMNVNVSNSALFRGSIIARPTLTGMTGVSQTGQLVFELDCDVVNPSNPSQTRNIGKLYGTTPVDKNNVYRFADGTARINVFGMGTAKGFESKFGGLALGKPPVQTGVFSKMKQEAISVARNIKGKSAAITVTKYDKMEFQSHVLAAGPVQIYPEVTVNGILVYDYGRTAWHFQNVTVAYAVDGKNLKDNLSGNIRWIETPNRKTTGEGEYQFDIRVNEPPPSEASVFAAAADESSFFATDDLNPALVGSMKYKDVMSGGTVTSSAVQINLTGNKLTKQQVMYLTKLLLLSTVVPINAE